MALSGLATHTPEQYEVAVEGKKPLKIRIILFFDGTLNNRMNIAEREKAELGQESESYQDFKTDDANSYDNGRTNIAIMEPHVSDKNARLCWRLRFCL